MHWRRHTRIVSLPVWAIAVQHNMEMRHGLLMILVYVAYNACLLIALDFAYERTPFD